MTPTTSSASFGPAVAGIRSGAVDPAELVWTCVTRLRADNPHLNAVVAERGDAALQDATALAGAPGIDGALAGVPFTAKDMLATADLPTTCGSRVLRDHRTDGDATAVA
ncbi:hypothetical protein XQ97_23320, partial [Salmonella enterica]|nr:hypothetical protein [Salmonella enterica]